MATGHFGYLSVSQISSANYSAFASAAGSAFGAGAAFFFL